MSIFLSNWVWQLLNVFEKACHPSLWSLGPVVYLTAMFLCTGRVSRSIPTQTKHHAQELVQPFYFQVILILISSDLFFYDMSLWELVYVHTFESESAAVLFANRVNCSKQVFTHLGLIHSSYSADISV